MSFDFSSYLTEPSSNYFESSAAATMNANLWQFESSPSGILPSTTTSGSNSSHTSKLKSDESSSSSSVNVGGSRDRSLTAAAVAAAVSGGGGNNYYTIGGRTQQNSRQFSKYYYKQVGTFLTQYKIRENYKFLQMISVPPLDPAVPKPEGGVSVPACGEPLVVPASFPQSIEAAIHKFANASSKSTCVSIVDQYGKITSSLTYGKNRNFIHFVNFL